MPPDVLARTDPDALAEPLAELFSHDLADQPLVAMKQFRAMLRADATPYLRELAGVLTLVVSGAHDRIAPPYGGVDPILSVGQSPENLVGRVALRRQTHGEGHH